MGVYPSLLIDEEAEIRLAAVKVCGNELLFILCSGLTACSLLRYLRLVVSDVLWGLLQSLLTCLRITTVNPCTETNSCVLSV